MSKSATMVLLDVSSTMSKQTSNGQTRMEHAKKAVDLFVQQKLLFSAKDEVGVLLFGTEDTENDLNSEMGSYEHITVLGQIDQPGLDLVRQVQRVQPSSQEGDFVDALIVALDCIHKRTDKKKYTKQILLVTDCESPIENSEDVDKIVEQCEQLQVQLQIIMVNVSGDGDDDAEDDEVKQGNEKMLRSIAENTNGQFMEGSSALEVMGSCRKKGVKQVTGFRGPLEIGEDLKINTFCFTQTRKQAMPSLKKLSTVAPEESDGKVEFDRIYRSSVNPEDEVPLDGRVKGYKYGQQVVPFSKVDEVALKFATEKELKVIGFCPRRLVPRQNFMAGVDILVAPPSDVKAQTQISALAHALDRENRVAIVRFVKRKNAAPTLCCLTPCLTQAYEGFHVNALPFNEDLREFIFAPFDSRPEHEPSSDQLAAANHLVSSMDLMTADGSREALRPTDVLNPVFQRFYSLLQARALRSSEPVPPVDPTIKKYIEQSFSFDMRGASKLFRKNFRFKQAPAGSKRGAKRKFWSDVSTTAGSQSQATAEGEPVAKAAKKEEEDDGDFNLEDATEEIVLTSVNTTVDFLKLFAKDKAKAIVQMEEQIVRFVKAAEEAKAIKNLLQLRESCKSAVTEADMFNSWMVSTVKDFEVTVPSFWKVALEEGATLVSAGECPGCSVSEEDLSMFTAAIADTQEAPATAPAEVQEEDDDDDNLFDSME